MYRHKICTYRGKWPSVPVPWHIRILGSVHWITDPYSAPDIDPALFVTVFQETNKYIFFSYVFLAYYLLAALRIRIRDPGSGAFDPLILNPRWKKSGSGIRDEYPGSYFRELGKICLVKNTWNSLMRIRIRDLFDPGSGIFLTLDPGWKNPEAGSGIRIPDLNTANISFSH